MGRGSGEIVYSGDWNELANAFNAEVRNRRGRGYTVSNPSSGGQINSSNSIQPLIQGLVAVTNSRQVNSDGSISGNTYQTGYGSGVVMYPLNIHRDTISILASISQYADSGHCGCYSGCVGLCAGCAGSCMNGCTGCTSCSGSCTGCSGCTGSCSGCSGCSGCGGSCSSSCREGCHGCEASHASAGCTDCICANYPS